LVTLCRDREGRRDRELAHRLRLRLGLPIGGEVSDLVVGLGASRCGRSDTVECMFVCTVLNTRCSLGIIPGRARRVAKLSQAVNSANEQRHHSNLRHI
jgi:hypothetical protein